MRFHHIWELGLGESQRPHGKSEMMFGPASSSLLHECGDDDIIITFLTRAPLSQDRLRPLHWADHTAHPLPLPVQQKLRARQSQVIDKSMARYFKPFWKDWNQKNSCILCCSMRWFSPKNKFTQSKSIGWNQISYQAITHTALMHPFVGFYCHW